MRVTIISLSLVLLLFSCAEETDTELVVTKKLANDGNAVSQYNLGLSYYIEEGVPQDYKEAVKWYRMAADQGDADAQYSLGLMYHNGEGVLQDYKEAYAWLGVAKANGYENAEENLSFLMKEMTKEQIADAMSLATEIQNRIEANKKD